MLMDMMGVIDVIDVMDVIDVLVLHNRYQTPKIHSASGDEV